MNKKLILSLIIFFSVNQAFAASATGDAKARVLNATLVSQTTALDFGSFIASGTAGTINQSGSIITGGITSVTAGTSAVFNVNTGANGGDSSNDVGYTFGLPTEAIISLNGAGSNPMTADLSFASGTANRTLSSGIDNVTINGLLHVAANQPAGLYTGTYDVTANY